MDFDVFQIASYLIPMLLSLSVHEYAHARSAWWLGDDTAATQGRLTLNPFAHADPIGTFVMPVLAQISGGLPLIGWAKPVPVNPVRFDRRFSMHVGMAITAVAGPLSNIVLVLLSVGGLRVLSEATGLSLFDLLVEPEDGRRTGVQVGAHLLMVMSFMNAGLAVFNLLPLPPLDGSRLLPRSVQATLAPLQMFSYFLLMGAIYFLGGIIRIPVGYMMMAAYGLVGFPTDWLQGMVGG